MRRSAQALHSSIDGVASKKHTRGEEIMSTVVILTIQNKNPNSIVGGSVPGAFQLACVLADNTHLTVNVNQVAGTDQPHGTFQKRFGLVTVFLSSTDLASLWNSTGPNTTMRLTYDDAHPTGSNVFNVSSVDSNGPPTCHISFVSPDKLPKLPPAPADNLLLEAIFWDVRQVVASQQELRQEVEKIYDELRKISGSLGRVSEPPHSAVGGKR